ncbi:MAG: type IV pilin-like G/H family protein [Coleofasciculus sp. B1-GNL1-01]|uniref:type IV pilin-like G/H family protein n=1 Tax=Coleofasciculus sp. B1-GNL1-01 TaxID=3068484 RepID=UPI003302132C
MVGSMNRAQQGYYLEEKKFSKDFEDLGLGVQPETEHYLLSTRITDKAAFNYVISHDKDVPSYVGGVFSVSLNEVESDASSNEMTMLAIICEANISGPTIPLLPTYQNGELACGEGTTDFSTIKSYY